MSRDESGQVGIAVTQRFRQAVERHDVEAAIETLAPDIVLHSPITNKVTFSGHDEMRDLFRAVFASIEDIRYFADIGATHTRALFYRATVKGQPVEEATRLQLNDDGLIQDITLFFRPLPGLASVTVALAPRVARRRGPLAVIATRMLVTPLGVMTRLGDRLASKFVK